MSGPLIRLIDSTAGSEAWIHAGYGFNCYRFSVPFDGRPLDVLWSEPDFLAGLSRPSRSGIPILFPFPGRIAGQSLQWRGREWSLLGEYDDRCGNAIHGFVLGRPWRVLEASPRRAVGQFQASIDEPKLLDAWPADFRITATYELDGTSLISSLSARKPGRPRSALRLRYAPLLSVPLGGGDADRCLIQLPVASGGNCRNSCPPVERLPVESPAEYRAGLPFRQTAFDDAFTGLEFEGSHCVCGIVDPGSGRRLRVEFDRSFRECVVFNPPHRRPFASSR